jgi:hypothetical protein
MHKGAEAEAAANKAAKAATPNSAKAACKNARLIRFHHPPSRGCASAPLARRSLRAA